MAAFLKLPFFFGLILMAVSKKFLKSLDELRIEYASLEKALKDEDEAHRLQKEKVGVKKRNKVKPSASS